MATPLYYWARLAPFNPKDGNVVRRHVYGGTLYQGGETPVWYKVSPMLAVQLVAFKQDSNDPRSPRLFEVYTEEDRNAVDAKENRERLAMLGVVAGAAAIPIAAPASMDVTTDARGVPLQGPGAGRAAAIPSGPAPLVHVEVPAAPPVTTVVAVSVPQKAPQSVVAPDAVPMTVLPPGAGDLTTDAIPRTEPR